MTGFSHVRRLWSSSARRECTVRHPRLTSVLCSLSALILGAAAATAYSPEASAATTGYVALGDSYSSGVGAGSYDSSSGACKRSTKAYPALWAAAHSPSSFTFAACSGARTGDVLAHQLGALNSSTGLVSITVGGNDAGFSGVMQTCVLQSESACVQRVNEARAYVKNTLPGKLDQVYDAIHGRATAAHVVVLGYPRFYKLSGSCAAGMTEKGRAALNAAADDLNAVTAKRAADHGFAFGDVNTTFAGHELCSGAPWLHSVTLPVENSFHPTAVGQSKGNLPVFETARGR